MLKWFLISAFTLIYPLAGEVNVLALSGSTRTESFNKKLINEAANIARQKGAHVTVIDLKDYPIPFYDGDLETNQGMPENAKRIRKLMLASDRIIIASPEYNGSLSAVLKNLIDWASRNEAGQPSRDAFTGKKFAIMSASLGGGGSDVLSNLRAMITRIGGNVISDQTAVTNASAAFNDQGRLENRALKNQLTQEIAQLLQ